MSSFSNEKPMRFITLIR